MQHFGENDVPDLRGRAAIVTGGNSGIGLEAARILATKGAHVVLGCRNTGKAKDAVDAIRSAAPGARVEARDLDLASLDSIRAFAARWNAEEAPLHLLCNNAGVMAIPRRLTADGFEMQLGTNHLGHFALTGLLLPRILATQDARVVNVSSTAHRSGRIDFEDLHGERSYGRWRAYGQSKLANLLFTFELGRRLGAKGARAIAVACHPGYAATNLQFVAARMDRSTLLERVMRLGNALFSQSAAMGALPTVYAATAPGVRSGDYFGPDGFAELWGHPKPVGCTERARDVETARRLWDVSETLTGVSFASLR